jgi:hypothetical protein
MQCFFLFTMNRKIKVTTDQITTAQNVYSKLFLNCATVLRKTEQFLHFCILFFILFYKIQLIKILLS